MRLSLPADPSHDELFTPLPTQEDPGTVFSREIADFFVYFSAVWLMRFFFSPLDNGMETIMWREEERVLELEAHSEHGARSWEALLVCVWQEALRNWRKLKDPRDLYQTGLTMRSDQISDGGREGGVC